MEERVWFYYFTLLIVLVQLHKEINK